MPARSTNPARLSRRALLLGAAAEVLGSGCRERPPRSREDVLAGLAAEVLVPNVREVARASVELRTAIEALAQSPSERVLGRAQAQWKRAAVAWKRAGCVRSGPLQESSALLRAAFWPARPRAIDAALASGAPLDADFVAELGSDVKGLHALEYLLFPAGLGAGAAVARFAGATGERRRVLCGEYARAVASHAAAGERALGDAAAFARRFASGGGESLALVVGELITVLETLAVERLDLVVRLDLARRLSPEAFEGGPSRTSHELATAQFLTAEQLYRGRGAGGVAELVTARAPRVSERVEQRWDTAVASVRALTEPLDELVKSDRPRLVAAISALKMLEIVLKVDVASTLGLTLSFPGGDGD